MVQPFVKEESALKPTLAPVCPAFLEADAWTGNVSQLTQSVLPIRIVRITNSALAIDVLTNANMWTVDKGISASTANVFPRAAKLYALLDQNAMKEDVSLTPTTAEGTKTAAVISSAKMDTALISVQKFSAQLEHIVMQESARLIWMFAPSILPTVPPSARILGPMRRHAQFYTTSLPQPPISAVSEETAQDSISWDLAKLARTPKSIITSMLHAIKSHSSARLMKNV